MKIGRLFRSFLLIVGFLLILVSIYVKYSFENVSFEQLFYSIIMSEGFSFSVIKKFVIISIIAIVVFLLVLNRLKFVISKITNDYQSNLIIDVAKKRFVFNLYPFNSLQLFIFTFLFFIVSLAFSFQYLGLFEYLESQKDISTIFEEYYVDPSTTFLEFPTEKRNLIYIYVESLEATNFSILNGGSLETSYIPKLESLAEEYTNFSNTSLLGGGYATSGSTWTIAGMISQTAGIPLKLNSLYSSNGYYGFGESLPGATSLGDILLENGYKNYLMMGSNSEFGGRQDYFTYHGQYEIYDYNWAVEENLISDDYYVWWGYEDSKLYSYAKDKLLEISEYSEPFNFTLLTADTHFTDGYLDDSCPEPFNSKYANVFYCTDLMLSDFIEWIMQQDFYENTTVIISGDHLTMQSGFYEDSDYDRVVYNVFINSVVDTDNNKNRIFNTLDMFPTTLAALGVEISGDRLGLGTNLYSNRDTLAEELGLDYLDYELSRKSNFYNRTLLGNTYYEIENEVSN